MTFLDKNDFDKKQLLEIKKGKKHGLSVKQLKAYAKEEFSDEQMYVIRLCLENKYDFEDINLKKLYELPTFFGGEEISFSQFKKN